MKWILLIFIALVSGCSNTKHWSEVAFDYSPQRVPVAKPLYPFERIRPITFLNSDPHIYIRDLERANWDWND